MISLNLDIGSSILHIRETKNLRSKSQGRFGVYCCNIATLGFTKP